MPVVVTGRKCELAMYYKTEIQVSVYDEEWWSGSLVSKRRLK